MFTQKLVDIYRENPLPTAFLQSFFTEDIVKARYIEFGVERGTEKVAVDVLRGADGNRNTFSRSTLKLVDPPYYREYFDATELDIYDRMFSSETIDDAMFAEFIRTVSDKLRVLQAKIERAIELQCAQVLTTGVVTVADGTNLDFKRKAGSLVDNSATPWTTGTNSPYVHIAAGAAFLRTTGKSQGGVFNLIMGGLAATALFDNAIVKARGPLSNINFDMLRAPQRNAVGANSVGQLTAGDYKINLWTYSETYEDASGNNVPYVDPKKVIMILETPRFRLAYARVPQLITPQNPTVVDAKFVFGEYADPKHHTYEWDVRSCPIAIPTAVDQIYTMQVVA